MSCWATGDVLSKCSSAVKSQTVDHVSVKAWVANDEDEKDCMLKNVSWGCCGTGFIGLGPDSSWTDLGHMATISMRSPNAARNANGFGDGGGGGMFQCSGFFRTRDGYGNVEHRNCYTKFAEKGDKLKANACREHEEKSEQCKPLLGFGLSVMAGTGQNENVVFGSNCYWRPSLSSHFGNLDTVGSAQIHWYNVPLGRITSSNVSYKDNAHNNWKSTPGYHYSSDKKPVQFPTDRKVIWENRTTDGSARFVVEVDHLKTCPSLGRKRPTVNAGSCGLSGIAECTYDADSLVGGCPDRKCVKDSLQTFITQTRNIMKPNPNNVVDAAALRSQESPLVNWLKMNAEPPETILEKAQMIRRNRGLAALVQGATQLAKCGEARKSCMAKLERGDCGMLSEFASEVQAESGVLYAALTKLKDVCYAEAQPSSS